MKAMYFHDVEREIIKNIVVKALLGGMGQAGHHIITCLLLGTLYLY